MKDTREVAQGACASRSTVAPERFDVKHAALGRRSRPTATGSSSQALGHLYVRDLPDGHAAPADARRTTTSSSSRASRATAQSIVYIDLERRRARAACASLDRRAAARDACSRQSPGHYLEPAFSPDGTHGRLPQGRAAATCARRGWSARARHLPRAAAAAASRRCVTRDGARAAVRRGERPRLRDAPGGKDEDELSATLVSIEPRRQRARASYVKTETGDRVRGLARRQVARLRRALQRLRRAASSRPASAIDVGPKADVAAARARLDRTPASTCTGPGDSREAPLVARARALHARARGRLRLPRRARPRSCPSRPSTGATIGFDAPTPTSRARHGRARRRRIVTMKRRRGDRGRRRRRRRQPHRGRRPARERSRCPPGAQVVDVAGKTDHARPRRRALARRAWARTSVDPAAELDQLRVARLRRHHAPRPLERHRARSSPQPSCSAPG